MGAGDTGNPTLGHRVHGLALLQNYQKLKASLSRQAAPGAQAARSPLPSVRRLLQHCTSFVTPTGPNKPGWD